MECLHVGEPPDDFECWERKTIYIHNFLDLPDAKGCDNVACLPEFKCFGHTWQLDVYPGGVDGADDGVVSVFINNLSEEKITVDDKIIIMKADGSESHWTDERENMEFTPEEQAGFGDSNLIERATLVENQFKYLVNGALVIKVKLRLSEGCYNNRIYQHSPATDYMDLFGSKKSCDIAFDFKGEILTAHKLVIKSKAKDFYVMCKGYSKKSPMPITDVDRDVFDIMLASLYGGEVYPEEWQKHSEAILKAASKYGFSTLESQAEAWSCKSINFTVENVVGKLMEADGKNHARIKAAAKKFIIEHGEEIVASDSFELLHESLPLMREVMAAFVHTKKRKRENGQAAFSNNDE
eukprot:scaffold49424_cov30-Cyclotella_meneghiniana.AAC.1